VSPGPAGDRESQPADVHENHRQRSASVISGAGAGTETGPPGVPLAHPSREGRDCHIFATGDRVDRPPSGRLQAGERNIQSGGGRARGMDAAIITVGDELLAGDTENTNATRLARRLTERGVAVRRVLTVPDETTTIADAVRRFDEAFDATIVTGGLGGTPDDVTMAAVARAFDRDLAPDDAARADLEATLERLREERPELNLDLDVEAEASIPVGARVLLNPEGFAPGCVIGGVYVLPGIPGEMRAMFETIADEFAGDVDSRLLYTTDPEANMVEDLQTARERFGVQVGCYPDREKGHNRLKLVGEDPDALDAAADWLGARTTLVGPEEGREDLD